ncbi:Variable surface protein Vir7-like [Plasmodium coatneyi]|uniref:Variable surface protein Vir7-like n=1 Tax=Plasmodium coatneyi TaxID=208452 RepID=A0A1B1E2V1_9APIC|nr:Variable surface protein Vir7-like [Plasmodium coatneyi]ANQ09230.1 Variable surface protein Vir7-like [Plasmodium coatneyi]
MTVAGEEHLKLLSAKKDLYEEIVKRGEVQSNCNSQTDRDHAKTEIGRYLNLNAHADKIVGAWCHIHGNNRITRSTDDRCYFFYYWLGDILSNHLKDSNSFKDVMGEIYKELLKPGLGTVCQLLCRDIDMENFKTKKIIYHYSKDRAFIEMYLESSSNSCKLEFSDHLKHIVSAYETVHGDCKDSMSSNCCKQFQDIYTKNENKATLELTCTVQPTPKKPSAGDDFDLGDAVVDGGNDDPPPPPKLKPNPNPNQAGSSGSFSDADLADGVSGGEGKGGSDGGGSHRKEGEESGSSSIVPAAVSGALAAVGLPALAFLFYKYKSHLFFLNKHNHSGNGGSRSKRFAIRREFNRFSNDDDYTENDSTTEYDSTNSSEYSIPYTTSSSR